MRSKNWPILIRGKSNEMSVANRLTTGGHFGSAALALLMHVAKRLLHPTDVSAQFMFGKAT
jgi:hypothetical protein